MSLIASSFCARGFSRFLHFASSLPLSSCFVAEIAEDRAYGWLSAAIFSEFRRLLIFFAASISMMPPPSCIIAELQRYLLPSAASYRRYCKEAADAADFEAADSEFAADS